MEQPSKQPAFDKTMQIGIVVPDVDIAVRAYEEMFGIVGWQIMEIGPENAAKVHVQGRPEVWKSKIAFTMVGSVMWELIEPLRDDDLFGRFLKQRGGIGGVHHVAVGTPAFQELLSDQKKLGNQSIMSGVFSGVEVHYLDTERDLGVILEVFSHMPDGIEAPTG